jgi:transcriptional regulator with XRE-family HTH domain
MTFAAMLAMSRKNNKLSQSALARAANIDVSHLNRIERGIRNPPSRDKVIALAQVLRMTRDETNQFLISAGYALEAAIPDAPRLGVSSAGNRTMGLTSDRHERRQRSRTTSEAHELAQETADELVNLIDSVQLKPRERELVLRILEVLPLCIREMGRRVIPSDETAVETLLSSAFSHTLLGTKPSDEPEKQLTDIMDHATGFSVSQLGQDRNESDDSPKRTRLQTALDICSRDAWEDFAHYQDDAFKPVFSTN